MRQIDEVSKSKILSKLEFLFEKEKSDRIFTKLTSLIEKFDIEKNAKKNWVDEKDVFLITYGDSIQKENIAPLKILHKFLNENCSDTLSYVHILPFYPFTSDDGFSVVDYFKVNPELGTWDDVVEISKDFKMMYDAVINHISAKSEWFTEYLKGNEKYSDYFIEAEESEDIKKVFRPRALPLLTKFATAKGEKLIWTTFSEDQIDLNYKSEDVFLTIIELLLFYVKMGAKAIRLDAIGFMWKELGTSCIHLPETHTAIQLYKDVFDIVAPDTLIITETNVPHKENISYFGDGENEAQMVYQFPLPPLVLYSLISGDASYLSNWASNLNLKSDKTTFFNFLASHDGIGVVPTHGILSDADRQLMIDRVLENGGHVSFKTKEDGSEIPYELNINYFDAVSNRELSLDENVQAFMCAQSILLCMIGVPAIYIHSLLGSQNYTEGVEKTGRYRTINRECLNYDKVTQELNDKNSIRFKVFKNLQKLIKVRKQQKALDPVVEQKILDVDSSVFALQRGSFKYEGTGLLALHNVSFEHKEIVIDLSKEKLPKSNYKDAITGRIFELDSDAIRLSLKPREFVWLEKA